MSRIILASGSPRRKELLEQAGLDFEICPARSEEVITASVPSEVVVELSKQKAMDITTPSDIMIIGADTIVSYEDKILGKPKDEDAAKEMLSMLSGKVHSVYTGVTIVLINKQMRAGIHSFFEKTDVTMYDISQKEIDRYVKTGEPMDKAGAYAIQGKCAIYIKKIDGDYNNVVGLPISRIYQELLNLGIDWYNF